MPPRERRSKLIVSGDEDGETKAPAAAAAPASGSEEPTAKWKKRKTAGDGDGVVRDGASSPPRKRRSAAEIAAMTSSPVRAHAVAHRATSAVKSSEPKPVDELDEIRKSPAYLALEHEYSGKLIGMPLPRGAPVPMPPKMLPKEKKIYEQKELEIEIRLTRLLNKLVTAFNKCISDKSDFKFEDYKHDASTLFAYDIYCVKRIERLTQLLNDGAKAQRPAGKLMTAKLMEAITVRDFGGIDEGKGKRYTAKDKPTCSWLGIDDKTPKRTTMRHVRLLFGTYGAPYMAIMAWKDPMPHIATSAVSIIKDHVLWMKRLIQEVTRMNVNSPDSSVVTAERRGRYEKDLARMVGVYLDAWKYVNAFMGKFEAPEDGDEEKGGDDTPTTTTASASSSRGGRGGGGRGARGARGARGGRGGGGRGGRGGGRGGGGAAAAPPPPPHAGADDGDDEGAGDDGEDTAFMD